MKVLFFVPYLNTVYAGKYIWKGYENAFTDMGHMFRYATKSDNLATILSSYKPEMLFISASPYTLKFLDINAVNKFKKRGLKVFANTQFWKSPLSKLRINESPSLSESKDIISLIKKGKLADIYYSVAVEGDPRMEGFEKATGYKMHCIPLAADKLRCFPDKDAAFKADVSFLGSNLPDKRSLFSERLWPLKKKYDLKVYGQDWYISDIVLGTIQKAGQFFGLPFLSEIRKSMLNFEDERKIYTSSKISLNIHETYQIKFGGDCNERTFKIPACKGFEIVDKVACVSTYLKPGKEIIVAEDTSDWFDKIDFYFKHPKLRMEIVEAGYQKVLRYHTYHNRVQQIINLYKGLL